ncbi:MAG: MarR family winged helix-turn-helix transcriptional regulator [Myxococcota bacterium]
MPSDVIDQLLDQWAHERPDLDASPMGVVGRVLRLGAFLQRRVEAVLEPHDLTLWQFDVLATLRRSGKPFSLSPTQLMREVMLSSGAMTNRLDRLETRGLVRRRPDPDDRRGVRIELTAAGRRLIDKAIATRFDEAREVVDNLGQRERQSLESTLRKLLLAVTPDTPRRNP